MNKICQSSLYKTHHRHHYWEFHFVIMFIALDKDFWYIVAWIKLSTFYRRHFQTHCFFVKLPPKFFLVAANSDKFSLVQLITCLWIGEKPLLSKIIRPYHATTHIFIMLAWWFREKQHTIVIFYFDWTFYFRLHRWQPRMPIAGTVKLFITEWQLLTCILT